MRRNRGAAWTEKGRLAIGQERRRAGRIGRCWQLEAVVSAAGYLRVNANRLRELAVRDAT
jgi:hypothetical protein